jgi:hypothetical protein
MMKWKESKSKSKTKKADRWVNKRFINRNGKVRKKDKIENYENSRGYEWLTLFKLVSITNIVKFTSLIIKNIIINCNI